jgi:two-component system response regulator FixJ
MTKIHFKPSLSKSPAKAGIELRQMTHLDPKSLRVAIIEDDRDCRQSLSEFLVLYGYRVMNFGSADEFLNDARHKPIGCILLDLWLPGTSGLEFLRKQMDKAGSPPIIVVTGQGDISLAVQAMKFGAIDFLEKPISRDALIQALVVAFEKRPDQTALELFAKLSPREQEVTGLIMQGLTTRAIAAELGVSHRTVECHRARILEKLNAANVAELVRVAMQAGVRAESRETHRKY